MKGRSGEDAGSDRDRRRDPSPPRRAAERTASDRRFVGPDLLETLLRSIPDAVWLKDPDGVYLACNRAFERLYGVPEDEIVGKTDFDFVPQATARFFRRKDAEARDAGSTRRNEEWVVHADGHRALWETAKTPMRTADGQFVGILGVARDITERRRAEHALHRSERRFREMFERHSAAMLLVSPDDGGVVDANAAAERLFGGRDAVLTALSYAELTGFSAEQLHHHNAEALARGRHHCVESHTLADGSERTLESYVSPVDTANGTLLFIILHDVTERSEAELRLRLAATVFTHAHDGVIICDRDERILEANPAFTEITGFSIEDAVGKTPRVLASGRHDAAFYRELWATVKRDGYWQGEVWNRKKTGELYAAQTSIAAVHDDRGTVTHYIGTFSDITALKGHQAQLERLAHHDPLTGLANRLLLGERLEWGLAQARRHPNNLLAVCYLDLDQFKPINDTHGHDVGALLLVAVGARLSRSVRSVDTVARLGGDEFVLLLTGIDNVDQCVYLAQRILDAVTRPIAVAELSLQVTASVGIALAPDDGVDADTLLRHADQAMYQAKQAGRNRLHLFDRTEERAARARRRQRERLGFALGAGELRLHYQPRVDLVTGAVLGVEALLRWDHPDRGLLPPGDFLPWIVGTELEASLGRWVLGEALRQADAWRSDGLALAVSVNVSASHFLRPSFTDELGALLAAHPQLPPQTLELEILESTTLGDLDRVTAILERCHALGARVALDDFGTGYSSLTHLRRLPVDTVKLDQGFVSGMSDDPADLAVVRSVIGLSQAFDRALVAEGIETVALGERLVALGCEVGQGYGIALPMAAAEIPAWIARFALPDSWKRKADES